MADIPKNSPSRYLSLELDECPNQTRQETEHLDPFSVDELLGVMKGTGILVSLPFINSLKEKSEGKEEESNGYRCISYGMSPGHERNAAIAHEEKAGEEKQETRKRLERDHGVPPG